MTPAESQLAQLLTPLIAQGGTVALLATCIIAMLRGYVITKHHHDETVAELQKQLAAAAEREAAGHKREAELLDLAFTGTQLAEQANDLRRPPSQPGRHPS